MDDLDRTFEGLKRVNHKSVEKRVRGYLTVDPETFELTLHHLYHHIVIGCGWSVEEFTEELNHRNIHDK